MKFLKYIIDKKIREEYSKELTERYNFEMFETKKIYEEILSKDNANNEIL